VNLHPCTLKLINLCLPTSDIVEKSGKSVHITQRMGVRPLEAAHPSAIVLISSGNGPDVGVVKSPEAAAKLLASGANSKPFFQSFDLLQPAAYTKLFTDLLAVRRGFVCCNGCLTLFSFQTHKVPLYVVNSKSKDIGNTVSQALSGALAKSATPL